METMTEVCTCDDNCDEPCPRHRRENQLQDRLLKQQRWAADAQLFAQTLMSMMVNILPDLWRESTDRQLVEDCLNRINDVVLDYMGAFRIKLREDQEKARQKELQEAEKAVAELKQLKDFLLDFNASTREALEYFEQEDED